jgi:hypothetical protein
MLVVFPAGSGITASSFQVGDLITIAANAEFQAMGGPATVSVTRAEVLEVLTLSEGLVAAKYLAPAGVDKGSFSVPSQYMDYLEPNWYGNAGSISDIPLGVITFERLGGGSSDYSLPTYGAPTFVDRAWGNLPMQPNTQRAANGEGTVEVVAPNAPQNFGWSGFAVFRSEQLDPALGDHSVVTTGYNGFPNFGAGGGGGTPPITVTYVGGPSGNFDILEGENSILPTDSKGGPLYASQSYSFDTGNFNYSTTPANTAPRSTIRLKFGFGDEESPLKTKLEEARLAYDEAVLSLPWDLNTDGFFPGNRPDLALDAFIRETVGDVELDLSGLNIVETAYGNALISMYGYIGARIDLGSGSWGYTNTTTAAFRDIATTEGPDGVLTLGNAFRGYSDVEKDSPLANKPPFIEYVPNAYGPGGTYSVWVTAPWREYSTMDITSADIPNWILEGESPYGDEVYVPVDSIDELLTSGASVALNGQLSIKL